MCKIYAVKHSEIFLFHIRNLTSNYETLKMTRIIRSDVLVTTIFDISNNRIFWLQIKNIIHIVKFVK